MHRFLFSSFLFVLTALINPVGASSAERNTVAVVRYNVSTQDVDEKQNYYIEVLKLALKKSQPEFGPFGLKPVFMAMPQGRAVKSVARGQLIDLVWTMTSPQREKELRAIYIPIMKGLMGYRIAIIRSGEQQRFTDIQTLAEFQSIILGQGQDWPDTDILRSQGFIVVSGKGDKMIDMLLKGRFDAFPRGLHEPWDEVKGQDDIQVESSLLIKYSSPIYFFVNKNNEQLAQRIEKGLILAIEDGSFDALFNSHSATADILDKAKLDTRKIFEIDNPSLSARSRKLLDNKALWLCH
ncbi:amino acid ABC transporter substrate-binding protein [Shewanella sp. YLB-07]|nr:amino acid ABC transporter substrate-binding protein [Shewanella sp. YLB-07]